MREEEQEREGERRGRVSHYALAAIVLLDSDAPQIKMGLDHSVEN